MATRKMRPRRCYLAGPMRTRRHFNYPVFMDAARVLRARGWYVYNPAEMDIVRDNGGPKLDMTKAAQEKHGSDPRNARRYATRDLKIITQSLRAECGDAIILLPGWRDSVGAVSEASAAHWVGLKLLSYEDAAMKGA